MSLPWIRTAAATLLVTTAVAACGANADSGIASRPSTTTTTSAPTATPPSTPTKPTPAAAIGPEMGAKTILAKTKAATLAARSVRLRGSFVDAGERVVLDVRFTKTAGQGTFTVGGGSMGIIVIGKTVYLQLSEKFIRAQGKADKTPADETNFMVRLMKDKWIKLSKPDPDFEDMISMTGGQGFLRELFQPGGVVAKTPQKTVDGVPAIGLTDGEGTLWVSTVTALPVLLEDHSDGSDGAFRFSDFNRVKAPKAPPASQTLDGRKIGL